MKTLTSVISSIKLIGFNSIPNELLPPIDFQEYTIATHSTYPEYIEISSKWNIWGSFIDYVLKRIIGLDAEFRGV